ncbi:hypothetical protein Q8A73_003659 [Channa argus]|nr:hypothetical protein Q8A73_003659 [Channa argus]
MTAESGERKMVMAQAEHVELNRTGLGKDGRVLEEAGATDMTSRGWESDTNPRSTEFRSQYVCPISNPISKSNPTFPTHSNFPNPKIITIYSSGRPGPGIQSD